LFGMVLAPVLGPLVGLSPGVPLAPLGLIMGGIVGATVVTALYRLPRALFALRHTVSAGSTAGPAAGSVSPVPVPSLTRDSSRDRVEETVAV
jgi:hypothetical protein